MDVDFQARRQHLARIAMARMIVHHEILREQLQHHAVFLQLHARGAVHHAVDVALLDFAHVPSSTTPRLLAPRTVGPPIPTTADSTETPASASASRSAARIALRDRPLVGDPALHPTLRFSGRASQEAQAAVLEHADHQPRAAAAHIETHCVNRLCCHGALFLCRNAVIQPQVKASRRRRLLLRSPDSA